MATIKFKGKIEKIYNHDDTLAFERIKIPHLTRKHCERREFYGHKLGDYYNSDLFELMLGRVKREIFGSDHYINLDKLPDCVSVNTSGFLAVVSVEV